MSYKSIFQDVRNAVDWVHEKVGIYNFLLEKNSCVYKRNIYSTTGSTVNIC